MNGKNLTNYLKRIGIALSILFNVLLFGPSNQTFSARNYGWKRDGKFNLVPIIDFVAKYVFREYMHCQLSWIYWRVRKDVIYDHQNKSNIGPKRNNANEPIYY
jgi:NADH:ubiquinone oxidoreductase subunit H